MTEIPLKTYWLLLKETFQEWLRDDASRISAALAYYSIFSMAPLLLIAISISGLLFGEEAARGVIEEQLTGAMGPESASTIEEMIESAKRSGGNVAMTLVGIGVILFSASGVFAQLKAALNTIWNVEKREDAGWKALVIDRFLSLSMVLSVAFLLLVSLILSTVLNSVTGWISQTLPLHPAFWQLTGALISFAVVTILFALIFKVLPDVEVRWKDIWTGALLTAALFTVGKFLLALYLGREGADSAHGAAGAVILILSWVYYTANIVLFGAEFTQVYARHHGRRIVPTELAQRAT